MSEPAYHKGDTFYFFGSGYIYKAIVKEVKIYPEMKKAGYVVESHTHTGSIEVNTFHENTLDNWYKNPAHIYVPGEW